MISRLAAAMRLYDRGDLGDFLSSILDRVELDPERDRVQLYCRIPLLIGVGVPRGSGAISTLIFKSLARVA